jgi:hypothetical protein
LRDDPVTDPIGSHLSSLDASAQGPRVAAASNGPGQSDIHFTWMNENAGEAEISHVWLPAAAPTPEVNRDLMPNFLDGQPRMPVVDAIDRGKVCLAWEESASYQDRDFHDVIRQCAPWSDEPVNVTRSSTSSGAPSLAMGDPFGALMLWQELMDPQPLPEEIRYHQSFPASLPSTVRRGDVSMPDIAFHPASGEIHAVWVIDTTEGSEVFYAHWEVSTPTPTPSATRTATRTPSPTRTATRTATPASPTPTGTQEITPTPITHTPTSSATPSSTPTPRPSPVSELYAPYLNQRLDE